MKQRCNCDAEQETSHLKIRSIYKVYDMDRYWRQDSKPTFYVMCCICGVRWKTKAKYALRFPYSFTDGTVKDYLVARDPKWFYNIY